MARVINRTTKQVLTSVNTPDYPIADWIINPTPPDCPSKYWNIVGDDVLEMSQAEKDVVDQSEQDAADAWTEAMKDIDNLEQLTRAFALVVLDEINLLRTETQGETLGLKRKCFSPFVHLMESTTQRISRRYLSKVVLISI